MWPRCGAGMLWVFRRVGPGAVEERRIEMWMWEGRGMGRKSWWWWCAVRRGSRMFGSGEESCELGYLFLYNRT